MLISIDILNYAKDYYAKGADIHPDAAQYIGSVESRLADILPHLTLCRVEGKPEVSTIVSDVKDTYDRYTYCTGGKVTAWIPDTSDEAKSIVKRHTAQILTDDDTSLYSRAIPTSMAFDIDISQKKHRKLGKPPPIV